MEPERLELVSAAGFDSAALAALFVRGYEGYFVPVHLDAAGFDVMARSGDLSLEDSRVGRLAGEPAGIALLGIRENRGWVGGVGVPPERRGRGDGRALMEAIITAARARGLATLALEVLVQNVSAARLYEKLGFRDTRRLDVIARTPDPETPAPEAETEALPLDQALALAERWEASPPPWQRERRSIERSPAGLEACTLIERGETTAVAVYRARKEQLGIGLACAAGPDRVERIRVLLAALLASHPGCGFQIINVAPDDPAGAAMAALGGQVTLQQREMVLDLAAV